LLILNNSSCTHTSTNAHGNNTIFAFGPLEFRKKSCNLTSSSATKRMAKGDGSTFWINFLHVKDKLLDGEVGLRCKCFIDLVDVNVVCRKTCFLESIRDSISWANS